VAVSTIDKLQFLPHSGKCSICRRCVSMCLSVCVCHTTVLYRNG